MMELPENPTIKDLIDVIHKLLDRIAQLEAQLQFKYRNEPEQPQELIDTVTAEVTKAIARDRVVNLRPNNPMRTVKLRR